MGITRWFRRGESPRVTVQDQGCLEGRAEAERRLRVDPRFAETFIEAFLFGDVMSADIGLPSGGLRAISAYLECFAAAVIEPAEQQMMFGELVDAKKLVEESFSGLTPDQRRALAVNLWRGARAKGVRVRDVQGADEKSP